MSDEEKIVRRDPDIELLGQKLSYPRRWQGVFVVLILSVTLVVVAYIILVQSRPENLQTLGLFTGNIQIGNDFIKKRDKFGFEFWTPSTHTAIAMVDHLKRFPEKSIEYQWQMHDEKTNDTWKCRRSSGRNSTVRLITSYRSGEFSQPTRPARAGNSSRAVWTWPMSISARTMVSSSPPSATTSPQGSTIMLWPTKARPQLAPTELAETRKHWFSMALTRLNSRQGSSRGWARPNRRRTFPRPVRPYAGFCQRSAIFRLCAEN